MEKMGKHDMGAPISESLERHYQEEIKRLREQVSTLEGKLSEASVTIDQLRFTIKEDEVKIEEYRNALVEQTLLATARK